MTSIPKVEALFKKLKKQGYYLSGSIFKVDFNGKVFTAGIWVRSVDLPCYIGKAKHADFDTAVGMALDKATAFAAKEKELHYKEKS